MVVAYTGRWWSLPLGGRITLGRSTDSDVCLPDDVFLSRRAASLRVLADCVVIRNESSSRPFTLRPSAGEDRLVEPGAGTTSLPYDRFTLRFEGCAGAVTEVGVDASSLMRTGTTGAAGADADGATITVPLELTPSQERVLRTLCLPLVTRTGADAAPATYAEIGGELDLSPQYVRNVLKTIREQLSGHGEAGLTAGQTGGGDDFRWPLARWAVRNGLVPVVDVRTADCS